MNKREFYFPSNDGMTRIGCTVWEPDGKPRGILQIAHGMVEFIDRYDRFARFMAGHGWLVSGNDHLGHGRSVRSEAEYGFFQHLDGLACALNDMHALRRMLQKENPDVPFFLLGHSMGSFFARVYLQQHGEGLSGAVIMGTGNPPRAAAAAGLALCRLLAAFRGWHHRSRLVDSIATGSYNKAFAPARTAKDWLTRDESIVDAYLANPWDSFLFTLNGYATLFTAIRQATDPERIGEVPASLPLLLVSGEMDPVGGFGREVTAARDALKQAGVQDVTMKLYPQDRHEILNELDHSQVDDDILRWLEQHLPD